MEFILILAIALGVEKGISTTSILFPNEVACEIARKKAEEALSSNWTVRQTAKGVCVPRQSPGWPKEVKP